MILAAPARVSGVNYQLPKSDSLCMAAIAQDGAFVDMIQGRRLASSGVDYGSGQFGPFVGLPATSSYIEAIPNGSVCPIATATVMMIYAKRDTTNRNSRLFAQNTTGASNFLSCHGPYSDGTVYWDFGGNTGGTSRLSVAGQSWVALKPSVWFFINGDRGKEIWRDGLLIASGATRTTRNIGTAAIRLGATATELADLVNYYAAAMWRRDLSPAMIRELSLNPWALFDSDRRSVLHAAAYATAAPPPSARRRYAVVN